MFTFQLQVFFMRLFGRIKTAYSDAFTIYHDLSTPLALMFTNTKKTNFVGLGCFAHVLKITRPIYFTKVGKNIVLLISILMVNMVERVFTRHVKPRKSVSKPFPVIDRNCPIPRSGRTSCSFSNKIWSTVMSFPCKLSCLRVVVKDALNMVMCNHESDFTIKVTA